MVSKEKRKTLANQRTGRLFYFFLLSFLFYLLV